MKKETEAQGLKKDNKHPWLVVLAVGLMSSGTLGSYAVIFGNYMVPICDELGFGFSEFSFYFTALYIGIAASYIAFGKKIPLVLGKPAHTIICAAIVVTGALMAGFTELWMFIAAALVIGICWAFTTGVAMSAVIDHWFSKRAGFAVGIAWMVNSIYMMIASPLASMAISSFGWRVALLGLAAVSALIVLPSTAFVVRLRPEDTGRLPYGYDETLAEVAVELENRTLEGVSFRDAVRSPAFFFCCLFLAIAQITACMNQIFPTYASTVGFSPLVGALMVSAASVTDIFYNPVMGASCDRFGVRKTIVAFTVLTMVSFVMLFLSPENAALAILGAGVNDAMYVVVGVGLTMLVLRVFGSRDYSRIFAAICAVGYIAGAFGMPIMTSVFDISGTFEAVFALCFVLDIVIAICVGLAVYFGKRLPWKEGC